jgi:uncharacterized membrane protein
VTGPGIQPSSSTGLSSNLGGALAYLLGCFSGIFFLVVERRDTYVRFHAMQSTLAFLGVTLITLVLRSLPLGALLSGLFSIGVTVLWVVLMIKAATGQRYRLPWVGEIAARQFR